MNTPNLAAQVIGLGGLASVAVDRSEKNPGGWRQGLPNCSAPRSVTDWPMNQSDGSSFSGFRASVPYGWFCSIVGDRGTGKTSSMARLAVRTAGKLKERFYGPGADDCIVRGMVRWVSMPDLAAAARSWNSFDDDAVAWRQLVRELSVSAVLYVDDLSSFGQFTNKDHILDGLARIFTKRHDERRFTCASSAVPLVDLEGEAPTLVSRVIQSPIMWELKENIRERLPLLDLES